MENRKYFNILIYSRPIDFFRNLQLSSIIGDCLINNLNPNFKIKTNFEIRYQDYELYINQNIFVDIQLIFITLSYYLVLLNILESNKSYFKNTILYSAIVTLLVSLEYYLADIPINKCIFIPKFLIFTLCCNLLNYQIKKFIIGIYLCNSFYFLIYIYYGLIYIFKIKSFNKIFNWFMIILESFSPYNRINLNKKLALTYMYKFSIKDPLAYNILRNYLRFNYKMQNDLFVTIGLNSIAGLFWIIIYFYLIRNKKTIKTINDTTNSVLKRSNERFKFKKDIKVKNLINIYDDKYKILNFELIKNSVYSSLS